MRRVGRTAGLWIKGVHILMGGAWVGAGLSLSLMMLMGGGVTSGQEMAGLVKGIKAIDGFLIIPAAMGSLITGFLISYTTQWGFFRFHWVTVKWASIVGLMVSGAFSGLTGLVGAFTVRGSLLRLCLMLQDLL